MNAKLYIGTDLIDLGSQEINVMFQVVDYKNIFEFSQRNRSYTIGIRMTSGNEKIFNFLNTPSVLTEKAGDARLYVNNLEIIRGAIKVLSINRIEIKIIITGDNFLESLRGKSIRELDLSASDHAFTKANVLASWSGSYNVYRYPMINFAMLMSGETGYTASWLPNDFIPFFRVQDIMELIFSQFGIGTSGAFTSHLDDTSYYKNMYISGAEARADEAFIKGKNLDVLPALDTENQSQTVIADTDTSPAVLLADPVSFNTETEDEGNDFASDVYTVPEEGTYRFLARVQIRIDGQFQGLTRTDAYYELKIRHYDGATTVTLAETTDTGVALDLDARVVDVDSGWVHLEAGDTIHIRYHAWEELTNNTGSSKTVTHYLQATTSYLKNDWSSNNLYTGLNKQVVVAEVLPDIDQLDFVKGVIHLVNGRLFHDHRRRVTVFEDGDTFIKGFGTVSNAERIIDITNWIDYTEPIEQDPVMKNYANNLAIQWKEDTGDYAYTSYKNINGIPHRKDIDFESSYAKQEANVIYNPVFASTVEGQKQDMSLYTVNIPRIFGNEKLDETHGVPLRRPIGFMPRLVYWNGLTAGFTWYYDGDTKTTYPKVHCPDWSTSPNPYFTYYMDTIRYLQYGKILTLVMSPPPEFMSQFLGVVNTEGESSVTDASEKEAFRAIYQAKIEGVYVQMFLNRIIFDGVRAQCEFLIKH